MNQYDIIIVGGGMVGLALAAKLKGSQFKIAVIDPKPVEMTFSTDEYDTRVSAITRASELLFKEVGAWELITNSEKTAYQKMYVWDGESTGGKVEFDAHSIAQDNIGHIIENRVLRKALYQSVANIENYDFLFEEVCQQVTYEQNKAELILQSGKKLTAKLLVAADGIFSWLRENSSIESKQIPYHQKAIVATIKTELPHQLTAYQKFDHKGPLAFLPLNDVYHSSIVWSQDTKAADRLLAMDKREFVNRLELSFEHQLGRLELASDLISFPLMERMAETNIKHRLVLIGDAAHSIHPLAGQGVNLGFSDVQVLAESLNSSLSKKKDIGLHANLRSYQRSRASEVFVMRQSMQAFKSLFAKKEPFWQMARSSGMKLFDNSPLIKSQVIKKALGV